MYNVYYKIFIFLFNYFIIIITIIFFIIDIDYIVIGSDSGKLVILEYNPDKNQFNKLHEETYGKTGCRRIVPGQYLAADPKGRAVMLGKKN